MSALEDELRELLDLRIRTTARPDDELLQEMHEVFGSDDGFDAVDMASILTDLRRDLDAEMESWSSPTDCARLEHVFGELREGGMICLHNAGYTTSDGLEDVSEVWSQRFPLRSFSGYCFYHGQDVERALRASSIMLSFGQLPGEAEGADIDAGRSIVSALANANFDVDWPGTAEQRIVINGFTWQMKPALPTMADAIAWVSSPPAGAGNVEEPPRRKSRLWRRKR